MGPDRKPLILFTPKYLKDGFGFLSFTTVIRKGNYIEYEGFKYLELRKKLPMLNEAALECIKLLTDQSLEEHQKSLNKVLKNVPSGRDLEALIHKKITRHINETFLEGIKHWQNVPWYHYVVDAESKKQIKCACYFLNDKVKLKFKVEFDDKNGLQLIVFVAQGNLNYLLNDFRRVKFLLEHKHQYFVLAPNDFATLEWLEELQTEKFAFRSKEFLLRVVWPLEEKGYSLDRNDCFKAQVISTPPQAMVLINEISSTFLQFIPCWNYEGIRLEGAWQASTEVQRQGDLYLVHRDKEAESGLIQSIKKKHPTFSNQFNGNFFIHFEEAKKRNWFFNLYQEWLDQGIQLLGLDLLEHFRYSALKAETKLLWIKSEDGITTFELDVRFGTEKIKNKELQKVIQAGQKSIFLEDNTIGVLSDEWLNTYALMIKHSKIKGEQLEISNWLLQSNLQVFDSGQKEELIPEQWQSKWRQWQEVGTEVYPVPGQVKADLRPYQRKGFEWMALLSEIGSGACLADDMGLGKTLQTISFLCWLNEMNPDYRFMIVCPSSLIYNWRAEFEKFAPHFGIRIFKGGVN
ncbi:MAG: SNF2-related protein, partial [Saprospiraceae bacterium]